MAEQITEAEKRAREAAVQEARDRENQAKLEKAYEASRTTLKAKGGKISSASKRGDGIATKGKTRGTMVTMCGGGMAKR
jgi:hypothetical protein